ncbi:hypothetical protein TBLA_0D03490 [Henningerozyma blattae CBS 6284]|uniref:Ribosome biogenesis protein NSA1 n=1 Tax=Henningerozyma blattae (strain ATCC 34711 / CBS 6284 / DSM 70876 / NBRC 10599 / NRRL Y-10934 / UCD 77-7) TaxID=1071380 RepID=I2H397_HENB6|nr:hypothetical protein TBLA_0D03490 [Tetrapisispora blattae CBS 6284]CCH60849.1 hypothetical protein TBLA_0D03490 [Tetrapisispora blattae CBS 6284]
MKFLVSCVDNGSIKEVICNRGCDTSIVTAPQPLFKKTSLSEGLNNHIEKFCIVNKNLILAARSTGVIELLKITQDLPTEEDLKFINSSAIIKDIPTKPITQTEKNNEQMNSIPILDDSTKENLLSLFDISSFEVLDIVSGLIDHKLLEPLYAKSKKRTKLLDGFVNLSLLPNCSNMLVAVTKSGMIHFLEIEDNLEKLKIVNSLNVKAPLEFAQFYDNDINNDYKDGYIMAYGGEENLVKLIKINKDLGELHQIWEAKNIKNDRLDLRVPVWPMALKFLNKSETIDSKAKTSNNGPNLKFISITRYSHLLKYDTNHGRKPFECLDLLPDREPLTQLETCSDSEDFKLTTLGNINSDDFNNFTIFSTDLKRNIYKFSSLNGRLLGKFGKKDITGYSTNISINNNKYLLQGGMDRYLRVYDISTGKVIVKIYMNSKINSIIMLDDSEIELPLSKEEEEKLKKTKTKNSTKRKLSPEEDEEDVEDLWKTLDLANKKKKA